MPTSTNTHLASVQTLGDGGSGGTEVTSAAAQKQGFFGTTPVVQPTAATAVSTSAPVSGAFGASTSAQWIALVTAVNTLIANNLLTGLDA